MILAIETSCDDTCAAVLDGPRILSNLISNALDALAEKGLPRRIWLTAEQTPERIILSLRDNGPGFSDEALAHAREPFFTTKTSAKGLGLGLAICDTLLRTLGGHLEFGNHPEGGALVQLHLLPGIPGVTLTPQEETRA